MNVWARRLIVTFVLCAVGVLAVGAALDGRVEVVRTMHVGAPLERVHAAIAREVGPGPEALFEDVECTAAEPQRGRWYDVGDQGRRKLAILIAEEGGGTRITWYDVQHAGRNPLARIAARAARRRRAANIEGALKRIRAALEE